MCGRYTLSDPGDLLELDDVLSIDHQASDLEPLYNICPTDSAPIIRASAHPNGHDHELIIARWGLIPWWAKKQSIGARHINARSETASSSRVYGKPFEQRRCLVPASGFFEWQKGPSGKQPIHIQSPGRRLMVFAGLWERASSRASNAAADEQPLDSFTILTTTPNQHVAPIHDRMPVILPPSAFSSWLGADSSDLQSILVPFTNSLESIPVGPSVNNVRNKTADCLAPARALADRGQLALDW